MKAKLIEIVCYDKGGFETYRNDFDTQGEAKRFAIQTACSKPFWDRLAESTDYAEENIYTVQLQKDGVCVMDWFPKFN